MNKCKKIWNKVIIYQKNSVFQKKNRQICLSKFWVQKESGSTLLNPPENISSLNNPSWTIQNYFVEKKKSSEPDDLEKIFLVPPNFWSSSNLLNLESCLNFLEFTWNLFEPSWHELFFPKQVLSKNFNDQKWVIHDSFR